MPLKAIYVLNKNEDSDQLTIEQPEGWKKMRKLNNQIFRRYMVPGFQQNSALWDFINQLAKDIPVYLVRRPEDTDIPTMGDFIEANISRN